MPRIELASYLPYRGFAPFPSRFPELISHSARFFPRADLENDESKKQLIPYVVLRFQDQVFAYSRGLQSSEKRLVEQWSIGLGGHIEWQDDSLFADSKSLYGEAARREVLEEVTLGSSYDERIIGLLNDDSNDVGRVHLGIVHMWSLGQPDVTRKERKIRAGNFMAIHDVARQRNLETWSQILVNALLDGPV